MNYIVLDLEWNQSSTGLEREAEQLPFEIIEIGAIKLSEDNAMVGEFSELVKPCVYHEMHHITSKLIHMQMEELVRGEPFVDVLNRFLSWCGDDYVFCTWGTLDLTELQRNMDYYHMEPLSLGPIEYLDVQKLFALAYEERTQRRSLEYGIDYLQLEKDIPFHRAFSDAYYTAKILSKILCDAPDVISNVSYDVYRPPADRKSEVKIQFETYAKYISRVFPDKTAAFADREVSSSKCYLCHRNLRKKIRWFSANGKHYFCLAYCEKHGYLKGKIRIHKVPEGLFVVKTTKLIKDTEVEQIVNRQEKAREIRRKRRHSVQ